jgi:hypothetical protein
MTWRRPHSDDDFEVDVMVRESSPSLDSFPSVMGNPRLGLGGGGAPPGLTSVRRGLAWASIAQAVEGTQDRPIGNVRQHDRERRSIAVIEGE